MRKFTFFLALMVAMVTTTMAQNYRLTETRLSSSELNSKTEPTLIAIKNLSKTNSYWFVGNTGSAPYSAADFSDAAVFVWEPVVEGVPGVAYTLKKLDGTCMTSTSPTTFSADGAAAALFMTTNPTTSGSDDAYFNGDGDTQYDDQAWFVRFVTGGKWINVQNGDAGTPVYNNGTGGWTLHNVYLVEELGEGEEPEIPTPSFKQTLADVIVKEITDFPAGVSTAKQAEETGENCGIGVVKQAVQNVKVTTPCEMTVNFQYTGGAHKLVVLGVDLVDAEGTVVAQDYHYGFTGGAAKDNTYTFDGTALATGNYTLRYFFCHKANDHEVGNQTADITVNGLEYTVTLPEGVVADPSELKSTAVYTIVPRGSARGVVYATAESTHLTTTAFANANPADVNQQFMFVENEGKMYLYSVGAGKFVNDEGQYLNLTAEPNHFITVKNGDGAGYMFINMNDVDKINVSTGWQYGTVANWNDSDDGNNMRITYVDEASQATLDALDAIFNPAPAEPVTFSAYALNENMQVAGELSGEVAKVEYVAFACSDATAALVSLENAVAYIYDKATSSSVAESTMFMAGDLGVGQDVAAMSFNTFTTPGTYVVYIPAGSFTINGVANEDIMSAEFTIPAPVVKVFEVESVTPADKEEVEAINEIKIKFTENITLQQNPETWSFYPVNLVDENNNVIELTTSDDANIWSLAVFTPAEPITAAGTYTLDLSQIKLDGGVCEGSYSWTVVEPVKQLEVVSYTPTEAVEKLETITITFSDEIEGTFDSEAMSQIYLKSQRNGCSFAVEGNVLTITPFNAITAAGEYPLTIPSGLITRKATGDAVEMSGDIVFEVKEAIKPLEVVSYTPTEAVEKLETITITFSDEIEGTFDSEAMSQIYLKSQRNGCSFAVEGNVLTITPFNAITAAGEYPLTIPSGLITRKATGDAVEMSGDIVFEVKEAIKPLEVVSYTPTEAVEKLETITITFSDEIEGTFDSEAMSQIYLKSQRNGCSFAVEGNVLTITPFNAITAAGEYPLTIPSGLITRKATGDAVEMSGDIVFTVKEASAEPVALEVVSADRNPLETAINGQYKLQGVKLNFGEVVKKYTTELTGDYGYILDAEGNEVAKLDKCMGGNGTNNNFATPYSATAIETPGTYKVVVKSGVILSADGTKEYKGGEFEFTVAERAVEISPSAEDGFCWNETYENVADFSEFVIEVKYAKSDVVINNDVKATMKTGETVYEAAVTVEKSGNTQYITLAFNGEFAEGRYSVDVPAGLFTVDGTANEAYAQSTFTYRKPQLEITRDFDTWESYLDQVWYMPTAAMITIANAESVEVDETKVATIAVGESVYSSTLNWYYDDWSNAYYIEYNFEDFFAEGFEFAKGDYTFTLPAGAYTVNGDANEEAVKTYTYGDPIIEEFNVTNVLPASGSTLESIDAISISFSNGMAAEILPVTCGDKTYNFVPMSGVYVPVDMNYEPITITEPGTYTLDLSVLEGLTGDKVFSWTIPAPTPTLNETVVFDFANNNWGIPTMEENNYGSLKVAGDYTDGTNTIHIDPTANKGSYIYDSKGFLNLGKPGSKIVLPAFDFAVEKIEVVGHPSATGYPNVDMNVYVGDAAVSTACIGSTATSTFAIAADNQAAGNVYELVIGSNGGNYSSVMYITYIKVYPAENKLEAPVFDLASGVYVGEQTVNAHSATTDIEGVTDVTYYYTTDGNEPTVEDEESVDGVITITNSCTLKVIVEFTLGDKTYVSASTSAEYIITEEVTYHRAVAVEAGNYFLVADGNVSAPIEGPSLPAVEVTVEGDDVTAPVYYAITLEEVAGGYYIKDVNGKYIYNSSTAPSKLSSGTYAPMDAWTIEIADDENSTATIMCNGYVLALNKGVFCTVQLGGTDVPVMPTLYGTYATGINEAVVNGEAIESIYDLTGRRVEKITKSGIYIVNGKKILVK